MNQKIAQYAAAAMLVIGAIYLVRNMPDSKTSSKAKDVTATQRPGSLTTTPIKTSAVAAIQEPLSALMTRARGFVKMFIPSSVDQHRGQDKLQPYGSSIAADAARNAPPRPNYRPTTLAGGNVVRLPPAR